VSLAYANPSIFAECCWCQYNFSNTPIKRLALYRTYL